MAQGQTNNSHNHSDDDLHKKWLGQTVEFEKFVLNCIRIDSESGARKTDKTRCA